MVLFLSFYPNNTNRDKFMQMIDDLKQYGDGVAHRYETLHITLAYIGEVEEARLGEVIDIVKGVCGRHNPVPVVSKKEGLFLTPANDVYDGRSLVYLWENNPELNAVYEDLVAGLKEHNFWFSDYGNYMPHSTLYMTYNSNVADEDLPAVAPCEDVIDKVIVYQCTTIDGHVAYYPLYVEKIGK